MPLIAHVLHALEPLLFAPAFAVMLIALVREHRERRRGEATAEDSDRMLAARIARMGRLSDRSTNT